MSQHRPHGFTLIELLVVVMIIAILAAIAVPNFLEAQTRSKLSRAASDMRVLVTALASYQADTNALLPADPATPVFSVTTLWRLTTPIAYITSIPRDVFARNAPIEANDPKEPTPGYVNMFVVHQLGLSKVSDFFEHTWMFVERGPDGDFDANNSTPGGMLYDFMNDTVDSGYDPTNGTISSGDLFRSPEGMLGFGSAGTSGGV